MVGIVNSGESIKINLTQYIQDGNNDIYITFNNGCKDPNKGIVPLFKITGVDASFTPTFEQYFPYDNDISFGYTSSGSATKIINCQIINPKGELVNTHKATHRDKIGNGSIRIPKEELSDGINTILAYMEVYNESELLTETTPITYKFPFFSEGNDKPLLMVYQDN
jgi:hypothetical protein